MLIEYLDLSQGIYADGDYRRDCEYIIFGAARMVLVDV